MTYEYSDRFFDYIDAGARRSADVLIGAVMTWLDVKSVADFGCGRGVWLAEWKKAGVETVLGVDGDYVERDRLVIDPSNFLSADLTKVVDVPDRFDVAQSLEVGEHLPTEASHSLVKSLVQASDIVVFSAAVVGQGGQHHINEQPLAFWQNLFDAEGYDAYDCLRPTLMADNSVKPWYRFNSIMYVKRDTDRALPEAITQHHIARGEAVKELGDLPWKLRRLLVGMLPVSAVTRIARAKAALSTSQRGTSATS